MGKFPEAQARLFKNKFVCKNCKASIKAPMLKVIAGRVSCRSCKSRALRPIKRK